MSMIENTEKKFSPVCPVLQKREKLTAEKCVNCEHDDCIVKEIANNVLKFEKE